MNKNGFTLIELMVVIGIISMIAVLGGLAIRGLGSGAKLNTDSAKLMGLIQMARDQAITSQHPTALALITSFADTDAAYRTFTIMEYQPPAADSDTEGTWTQVSRWNSLSSGIVVDFDATDSNDRPLNVFQPNTSPRLDTLDGSAGHGNLRYLGRTFSPITDYQYLIFLANGSIYRDDDGLPTPPYRIRLVEGRVQSDGVQYTNIRDGKAVNFAEILLNEQTGQMKLVRPENMP